MHASIIGYVCKGVCSADLTQTCPAAEEPQEQLNSSIKCDIMEPLDANQCSVGLVAAGNGCIYVY